MCCGSQSGAVNVVAAFKDGHDAAIAEVVGDVHDNPRHAAESVVGNLKTAQ